MRLDFRPHQISGLYEVQDTVNHLFLLSGYYLHYHQYQVKIPLFQQIRHEIRESLWPHLRKLFCFLCPLDVCALNMFRKLKVERYLIFRRINPFANEIYISSTEIKSRLNVGSQARFDWIRQAEVGKIVGTLCAKNKSIVERSIECSLKSVSKFVSWKNGFGTSYVPFLNSTLHNILSAVHSEIPLLNLHWLLPFRQVIWDSLIYAFIVLSNV